VISEDRRLRDQQLSRGVPKSILDVPRGEPSRVHLGDEALLRPRVCPPRSSSGSSATAGRRLSPGEPGRRGLPRLCRSGLAHSRSSIPVGPLLGARNGPGHLRSRPARPRAASGQRDGWRARRRLKRRSPRRRPPLKQAVQLLTDMHGRRYPSHGLDLLARLSLPPWWSRPTSIYRNRRRSPGARAAGDVRLRRLRSDSACRRGAQRVARRGRRATRRASGAG